MNEQEIIEKCLSIAGSFEGNDHEYIVLLYKIIN